MILYIWSLSLPYKCDWSFVNFVYLSEYQLLIYWCFLFFSVLFIYFFCDLYYFLPSTNFELCFFFFSSSLNVHTDWEFSYSWDRQVLLLTSLIELLLQLLLDFGKLCFHFSPRIFLISSLISFLTHWLFSSMLVFTCLRFFIFFNIWFQFS